MQIFNRPLFGIYGTINTTLISLGSDTRKTALFNSFVKTSRTGAAISNSNVLFVAIHETDVIPHHTKLLLSLKVGS